MRSGVRRLAKSFWMIRAVVDSSVLLAYIRQEPVAAGLLFTDLESVVSAVNVAEVVTKLIVQGATVDEAWVDASEATDEIVAFSEEQARVAGSLIEQTRRQGLSLGDRACLALGIILGLPVYTTDRAWAEVEIGIPVHVIR